ncbi:hypothetical protein [Dokdonella ginsengisoli]|uniref:Uncharacterized protein n=1 Tax=Dokdonella ginsengisoli TaxID=363846 RepID=A0ABV9QTY5_9GAMM
MNTRMLRSALTLALIAGAAAHANAATMSVDAGAPIQATLLPEVTVVASSSRPYQEPTLRVAATAPLSVTLLPTVHVNARAQEELAMVVLPTVRVVAQAEEKMEDTLAYQNERAHGFQRVNAAATSTAVPGFRASLMPQ